ncbi:hypothetical protein EDD18DRAFT_1364521 [Armillaria luteobubalina]|uniref:JmjC domain-containing protein n=1 Tax=Armillaria luteobubalina TaxID=153913 RepID=A0AA39P7G7_9AGAR|nr:hypothetical protein EDD18DRAFT_1364521 [Armillaria luteobubalina]
MSPKSLRPADQMQRDDEAQPSQEEKEYASDDSEAKRRLRTARRAQANAYKHRHPEATQEEIDAKYPQVTAPRKRTKREIGASQRREGESEEHFAKRLRSTEQKRLRRAVLKSGTATPGPSRKARSQSQLSPVPVPPSPPIDPILLGPQPPATPSRRTLMSPIPVPPSPPIDPVLLAPELPPPAPSRILCENGTQTNVDATIKSQSRRITDFGVGALGVHPDAPTITWDRVNSPEPARVVLPHLPQDDSNLLLAQAKAVRRHAHQSPILEDSNEYVVFMRAPFPPDAELNDIIMDHLVHHRGVKLEGFRPTEVVEQLTSEYMATNWNVQPARVVEVHDTVRQINTPVFPFKKMLHSQFIDGLSDPRRSEKILDVPMTHRGAPPPFGLMDDGYDAWNNTSSQYDWPHGLSREQWSDMNWGLLHHATTYTDEHHDADGKMTLIIGEQGSKLWAVTFPKKPLEREEVHTYFDQALQFELPTEEDELLCVSFTLVLLPGDIYFQPPGAIHTVYTPEASFTRGASFWSLDTMHQAELSRRYDSRSGLYSTNLDHAPERVYEGLVRIMLSLPTNPDKLRYKRSLGAFLLMIMDPRSFLPNHGRAYGIPIPDKPTKPFKDSLQKARDQAFASVKKCPWAHEAIEYASRVAGFLGWTTKKDLLSYLEQTDGALSDPGEKISIAPILRQFLSEQEAARKAEDEAAIQAVLEAEKAVEKAAEKAAEKATEKKAAKKGKIKN